MGPIAHEFIDLKTKELETYGSYVTPWEIQRYLTSL